MIKIEKKTKENIIKMSECGEIYNGVDHETEVEIKKVLKKIKQEEDENAEKLKRMNVTKLRHRYRVSEVLVLLNF
jgi:hypothetical protein